MDRRVSLAFEIGAVELSTVSADRYVSYVEDLFTKPQMWYDIARNGSDVDAIRAVLRATSLRILSKASNLRVRSEFKFGCSRGVTATPFYFINGVHTTDGTVEAFRDATQWTEYLKSLFRMTTTVTTIVK